MKKYFLEYFKELSSTNLYAKSEYQKYPDKTVIVALNQTNGRGRFDRVWCSNNQENAYFSVILKPNLTIDKYPIANLTQYCAYCLYKTLKKFYNIKAQIKWPNDLLVDYKKISGILCESIILDKEIKALIVGIGVNLNWEQAELENISQPATSLNLLLNKKIKLNDFLNNFLNIFFSNYEIFIEKGFLLIKNDYQEAACFLNKKICIKNLNNEYSGVVKSIDNQGALILELASGELKQIIAGDIVF